MAVLTYIETDTGTNVDISAATAVGAYTSTGDKLVMCDVSIDAVAGNGDYVMYVTRQIGGSGSAYRLLPQTTLTAASGLTAISAQSGWITVRNGDVLTVYVDGLAGDTTTPDWTTRWFELAGVTAAGVADAVWDEAIADHTTSTAFGGKNQKVVPSETIGDYKADVSGLATPTNITAGTLTTVTNLTNLPAVTTDWLTADGVKADAVTKIQSGLATATALATVQADLDNPSQYKADVSGLMTAAAYTAPDNAGIAAIESKTNNLPTSPAPANEYDARMTAIQADLDNPDQYKADVSAITGASLSAAGVDAILDEAVVGSYTMRQLLKVMAAALAGKLSGGGTATLTFRGVDDASDVIVTTVDANKNRTNVTLTV